jgi:pSer/pThr/pTyr-binding forkhead associated (FHA) protein
LLLLRLGFLGALYLFLFFVARAAWRELRPATADSGPAIDLTMLDPARSHWQPGQRVRIRPGSTVGRSEGNTLVIDEDTVSAQHAVFRHERGRWWLVDLDSTNGTFINGRPVTGRQPLATGDQVSFGRVALAFGAVTASGRR